MDLWLRLRLRLRLYHGNSFNLFLLFRWDRFRRCCCGLDRFRYGYRCRRGWSRSFLFCPPFDFTEKIVSLLLEQMTDLVGNVLVPVFIVPVFQIGCQSEKLVERVALFPDHKVFFGDSESYGRVARIECQHAFEYLQGLQVFTVFLKNLEGG